MMCDGDTFLRKGRKPMINRRRGYNLPNFDEIDKITAEIVNIAI